MSETEQTIVDCQQLIAKNELEIQSIERELLKPDGDLVICRGASLSCGARISSYGERLST